MSELANQFWSIKRLTMVMALIAVAIAASFATISAAQASGPPAMYWTDWTGVGSGTGFVGTGTITTPTSTVGVTYSNAAGIAFYDTGGGTDYWQNSGGGRDAATSPYTSDAVANIPTGSDIIALRYAGSQTLTFSEEIANPVFSYVSLNGNGYGFDQDFEILSFGHSSDGNSCGYWGCGTSYKNIVDLGGGNFEYQLLGTAEPHGTIRFLGSFSTVSWRSLSSEYWNGFTVGVAGTAIELPDNDGDGYTVNLDCDDTNASTFPGAPEVNDGLDNDCDGIVPEVEIDGDADGYSELDGDCDDSDPTVNPDGFDVPNDGIDQDCDGADAIDPDDDGDGVTLGQGDCDDNDASRFPGNVEINDGVDNDCDGIVPGSETDDDGDGQAEYQGDCDDADATTFTGAPELLDGKDNDCDGGINKNDILIGSGVGGKGLADAPGLNKPFNPKGNGAVNAGKKK